MQFDISRSIRQDKSVSLWRIAKGIGGIDACPRFGKTQIGLNIIDKMLNKHPNAAILIVTPSDIVSKIWEKHNIDNKFVIQTSHALKRTIKDLEFYTYDLLIVDELHKFTSQADRYLLDLLSNISKFRLALSGSYPYNTPKLINLFPVVDVITEDEAIKHKWITPFNEFNIGIKLLESEETRYTKYSDFITETMKLFKGKSKLIDTKGFYIKSDFDYIMKCYTGFKIPGKYIPGSSLRTNLANIMGWRQDLPLNTKYNVQLNEYWNPNAIYERVKSFKNIVKYRNELINNNTNKLQAILEIIKYNDVPTIIFNESTIFVDIIAKALGDKAIAYHSNIESKPIIDEETGEFKKYKTGKIIKYGAKRLKDIAIKGIESGKYKYLVTAKALDEGLDLPILEQVIITSGSVNPMQQQQRAARGKTYDYKNINKITNIFNLYIDDYTDKFGVSHVSRDKTKLELRQGKYEHEIFWLNNIDDIKSILDY